MNTRERVKKLRAALLFALMTMGCMPNVRAQSNWGFERGDLSGWTQTGDAFRDQPTYGDNVAARMPGTHVNQSGDYWIGTSENRPNPGAVAGGVQGDGPQGTLTSDLFTLAGPRISLLVGGGGDLRQVWVELLVKATPENRSRYENVTEPDGGVITYPTVTLDDGNYYQVFQAAGRPGRPVERMERVNWYVQQMQGDRARIRIVDASSGPWGHINVDDIQFAGSATVEGAPGDLQVTGMEVTQAVQVYHGNGVPLIARKPTLVRVYVSGREDARGRWEGVAGTLTVRSGGTVVGRVQRPLEGDTPGTIAALPGGSHRDSLDDSLNFLLDPDQVAPGERQLEVSVSSVTPRPESDMGNNTLSQTVNFRTNDGFAFYGTAYTYTSAPGAMTSAPFSDFEAHRAWALSSLPTAGLWAFPYPGYPIGQIAHRMVTNPDGTMGDAGYEDGRAWAERQIDRLFPHGGQWVVVMQPEEDPGWHGAHYIDGVGNHVINMMSNHWDPGPTLAHEIGHGWSQPHTWDNAAFPHPDGRMGPQVGVRLGTGALQLFSGDGIGDMMSYVHPSWYSPYSYTEVLRHMTDDAVTVPASVRDARLFPESGIFTLPRLGPTRLASLQPMGIPSQTGADKPYLYVSGRIGPDGTATFDPFETLDSAEDLGGPETGKEYSLAFEDAAGKTLAEHRFDASRPSDGEKTEEKNGNKNGNKNGEKNAASYFGFYMPSVPETSRITLVREGKILAERKVSPNPPKVTLDLPSGGEGWKGTRTLRWKAEDADGDPLTYTVWYSANGGKNWLPIQTGLGNSEADLDFDYLAGSDEAMLRVLASDGVNTAESRSEAIRVPRKAPVVSISPPSAAGRKQGSLAAATKPTEVRYVVSETHPLIVSGSAFDFEDGPLNEETAYRWSSDRDGDLGTGPWIVLRKLSPGVHRLTLTASDSDKDTGSATMTLTVLPPAEGKGGATRRKESPLPQSIGDLLKKLPAPAPKKQK